MSAEAGCSGTALQRTGGERGLGIISLSRGQCDVTRAEQVAQMFERFRPTIVVNCAAHTGVDACENEQAAADAVNGAAVGLLAREAKENSARLVHFSTDFVFNGRSSIPYREEAPPDPISAYGRSKALGETALKAAGGDWLMIRTAWLFGTPGACFPRTILELARAGVPLRVVNDQVGSPTFADDLAEAVWDLLAGGASGIYHVAGAGSASWFEVARATVELAGIGVEVEPISTDAWQSMRPRQALRPAYSVLDVSRVSERLGREMRPWREALAAFVGSGESSLRAV